VAHRFPLSAFADEISPNLDVQIQELKRLGVGGLDVRSVDGVNVLDITAERLDEIRHSCESAGLRVEAVGSPVNKVTYTPEAAQVEMGKLHKSIEAAKALGVAKIRIFSPHIPQGREEAVWPEALAFMRDMANLAQTSGVVLMHENDSNFIGAYPAYAEKMFEALGGPHFRAAYDFANGVPLGFRPLNDWFPWLLPHLDCCHIKDCLPDGTVMPAGQGEGQIGETLEYLMEKGWCGTLTLEPHLKTGGPYGGTSGPELFEVAVHALRKVVTDAGGEC